VAKALGKTKVPESPSFPILFETLGIVFAFESPLTLDKVADHYRQTLLDLGGLGRHIDYVFVLDQGMVTLATNIPGEDGWAPSVHFGAGGAGGEGAKRIIQAGDEEFRGKG